MSDCITEYIQFCEQTTLPARTVRCYPNHKPGFIPELKVILNKKKKAFRSGDREELRDIHKLCSGRETDSQETAWRGQQSYICSSTGSVHSHHLPPPTTLTDFHTPSLPPIRRPSSTLPPLVCSLDKTPQPLKCCSFTEVISMPVCYNWPGEETAGEASLTQGPGTRRYQPHGSEDLCQPARCSSSAPLQPEPSSGEDACAVENVLPGSSSQEVDSFWPQRLSTYYPHISWDEGPGETGPGPPQTTGEINARPSPVRLVASSGSGWCNHLPAAASPLTSGSN